VTANRFATTRPSIVLGGEVFGTPTAAMAELRAQLTEWLPEGTGVFVVVGAYTTLETMLFDAVERHPARDEKIGAGVARFLVRRNVKNPRAAETWIERVDGSRIDFSWRKCATGRATSVASKLRSALREAVRSQIDAFRWTADATRCAMCDRKLDGDPGHVDHIIPFETLVRDFLSTAPPPPVAFDDGDACQAIFRPDDATFAAAWVAFHARHAQLRLVHARCNLSRGRGGT